MRLRSIRALDVSRPRTWGSLDARKVEESRTRVEGGKREVKADRSVARVTPRIHPIGDVAGSLAPKIRAHGSG